MADLSRTALYDTHVRLGARMVPFAGWEMPVSYTGISEEHKAVRDKVGLFDVSHMGELIVSGAEALKLVQHVTTNDASRLVDGQAQYSTIATDQGGIVDDLLVYRLNATQYMLVVNASNITHDLKWIRDRNTTTAQIADRSAETGLVAVQGPRAPDTLSQLTPADLSRVHPFRFVETSVGGVRGTLSRTGYTGEDGFEFYFPTEHSVTVWESILEGGGRDGILPAGLGARNTLRLEARLLLHGTDIDMTTNPYEAGLGQVVCLNKESFVGSEALRALSAEAPSRQLVGFEMEGRRAARDGYLAFVAGKQVGRVTSGAPSVTLERNIGLCYLRSEHAGIGTEFQVDIRGRLANARVVRTPFYKRREPNEP